MEPGSSVLLNHKSKIFQKLSEKIILFKKLAYSIVGIMQDEVDPLLNVMKVFIINNFI